MSSDAVVQRFIGAITDNMMTDAEAVMMRPSKDIFELGISIGKYQGQKMALSILTDILYDDEEKERKS